MTDACMVCDSRDDGGQMLLCDNCDAAYHVYCLDPPEAAIPAAGPPEQDWLCPQCGPDGKHGYQALDDDDAGQDLPEDLGGAPDPYAALPRRRRQRCGMCRNCLNPAWHARCMGPPEADPADAPAIANAQADQPDEATPDEPPQDDDLPLGEQPLPTLSDFTEPGRRRSPRLNANVRVTISQLEQVQHSWDLTTVEGVQHILQLLMPGSWDPAHVKRTHTQLQRNQEFISQLDKGELQHEPYPEARGIETLAEVVKMSKLNLGLTTVCTNPAEVVPLLQRVDLLSAGRVYDPWAGTCMIEAVLNASGVPVHSNDAHPASPAVTHENALHMQVYQQWKAQGMTAVVTSPHFQFLDIAIPLAAAYTDSVACFHIPSHYYASATDQRWKYLSSLDKQGRLETIMHLPYGPLGRRCMWLCVFASAAERTRLLR